ncbi:MAG: decaprenyl-phosphate phosphoribosyltransferase [Gammaproteobacteria bacterium]|nr:decaprenyl-phosphate phosphoribosyltransferase [Gammaproteobacteria bacterium]
MNDSLATPGRSTMGAIFALLRPREWTKNIFVLAPLVFAGAFSHDTALYHAGLAFLLFCVAASAVYIVNDIHDIDEDRAHPLKRRKRPLAAGELSPRAALVLLVGLYGLLAVGYWLMPRAGMIVIGYVLLNIAHTYLLKLQPVIDIFSIAIGFMLRVYAGAEAIAVPVSSWMFVTTLCLALYLASIKRRQELNWAGGTGRAVLQHYTAPLLDRFAQTAATGALIFYSLFVMSTRPELVASIPFVLFGLFRYQWLVEVRELGESPADTLLGDWQLMLTVLFWLGMCAYAVGHRVS